MTTATSTFEIPGVPRSGAPSRRPGGALVVGDEDATRLLDAAVRATSSSVPGLRVRPWLARVRADELVGELLEADLLLLGGPRPDRWGEFGLVARSALFHAPCAVLLTPRPALSTSGPWSPTFGEQTDLISAAGGRP
jgi:nucleotide-binding universal stress UspA family protein